MMLELKGTEPFAVGGTRRCYLHPDDPAKCVKVLREDRTPERRRTAMQSWRKFRPLKYFDDQWKEWKTYERLAAAANERTWLHVPTYYGMVDTDMGLGIVTKLYRNYDGSFPLNLENLLPQGIPKGLEVAMDEFKDWLRSELFLTRGLLPHNIIAVLEDKNRYRLVIVDGIGNSEMIPISNWFGFSARQKVERKIHAFDYRVQILLPGR